MVRFEVITPNRRGASLMEVVIAAALIAITLVPALRMIRDGLAQSRQTESRQLVTTLGTGTLEKHLALAGAHWETGSLTGDFAGDGYPQVRYLVQRSDAPADGGITDRLMAVTATVWEDLDGDAAPGASECRLVFASKVAKLSSYQAQVGP